MDYKELDFDDDVKEGSWKANILGGIGHRRNMRGKIKSIPDREVISILKHILSEEKVTERNSELA
jgi:hypothetical protein